MRSQETLIVRKRLFLVEIKCWKESNQKISINRPLCSAIHFTGFVGTICSTNRDRLQSSHFSIFFLFRFVLKIFKRQLFYTVLLIRIDCIIYVDLHFLFSCWVWPYEKYNQPILHFLSPFYIFFSAYQGVLTFLQYKKGYKHKKY